MLDFSKNTAYIVAEISFAKVVNDVENMRGHPNNVLQHVPKQNWNLMIVFHFLQLELIISYYYMQNQFLL